MFSLEIDFHDGVSPPEILLVRRPHAIIGTSDFAHVVIEGAASVPCDVRLTRGVGREFSCQPVRKSSANGRSQQFLEGVYNGEAELNLGEITTYITSLDADLQILPQESPDDAGVRVLRRALSHLSPVFPALAVVGASPVFVSFPDDQPLLVGRSRKCGLRLDSSGISGEHARIGYSNGNFWVEDLGSTNGTFVNGEQVSGRRTLKQGERVIIGSEFTIAGVASQDDLLDLRAVQVEAPSVHTGVNSYPCILSRSDVVRPNKLSLEVGQIVHIGRDPANDIWLGAAHISREHALVELKEDGTVEVTDKSSNGTFIRRGAEIERLRVDVPILVEDSLFEVDFKEGVTIAICFSQGQEQEYLNPEPPKSERKGERARSVTPEPRKVVPDMSKDFFAQGEDEGFSLEPIETVPRETEAELDAEEAPQLAEFSQFKALLQERSGQLIEQNQTEPEPYLISEETALRNPSVRIDADEEDVGVSESELDRFADQLFDSPFAGRVILIVAISAVILILIVVISLLATGGKI